VKKGFTLIELLIVVAIIAILAAIAVPNFLEAQVRSKVSRVKSDQRSLATAIEAYFVDNNLYPATARDGGIVLPAGSPNAGVNGNPTGVGNVNKYVSGATGTNLPNVYCFAAKGTTQMAQLTSPIGYITSYFSDPFCDTRGAYFGYFANSNGWILWSPGPDTDQGTGTNLGLNATSSTPAQGANTVETLYDIRISQPSVELIAGFSNSKAFTYDPTNGTVSPGDVWRVKQ
jgi:prepilin-type N-terminal cleavage/methylation domain-containing protein